MRLYIETDKYNSYYHFINDNGQRNSIGLDYCKEILVDKYAYFGKWHFNGIELGKWFEWGKYKYYL